MQNYEMRRWEKIAIVLIFILLLIIVAFSTTSGAESETQEMLVSIEENMEKIHSQSEENMEKMQYVESLVIYLEEDMEQYQEEMEKVHEENEEQEKALESLEELIEELKERLNQSEKKSQKRVTKSLPVNEVVQVSQKADPPEEKQVVSSKADIYEATAYDLSVQSTGKSIGHEAYGVTRSGFNISGMNRKEAMTVAVDPSVIPLGTRLKVEIDNPKWDHLNGVYTARDTGGAIKGKKIDIFLGDQGSNYDNSRALQFGRQRVRVSIVK